MTNISGGILDEENSISDIAANVSEHIAVNWGFYEKEDNYERLKREYKEYEKNLANDMRKAQNENDKIDVDINKIIHPKEESKSLMGKTKEFYGRSHEVKRMLGTKYDNRKKIKVRREKLARLRVLGRDFNVQYEVNTNAVRNVLEEEFEKDLKKMMGKVDRIRQKGYEKKKEKWVKKQMIDLKLIKKPKHFILF